MRNGLSQLSDRHLSNKAIQGCFHIRVLSWSVMVLGQRWPLALSTFRWSRSGYVKIGVWLCSLKDIRFPLFQLSLEFANFCLTLDRQSFWPHSLLDLDICLFDVPFVLACSFSIQSSSQRFSTYGVTWWIIADNLTPAHEHWVYFLYFL